MQIPGVAHCSLEYYRWAVRSLVRPDGMRFARRMATPVHVPTLQLHGELDRCVLASTAKGSARHAATTYEWQLLDGLGHFPHEEKPQLVSGELVRWCKGG